MKIILKKKQNFEHPAKVPALQPAGVFPGEAYRNGFSLSPSFLLPGFETIRSPKKYQFTSYSMKI